MKNHGTTQEQFAGVTAKNSLHGSLNPRAQFQQEMISGQVALRELGIGRIPVVNVENACATSSTAFNQACAMVTAGLYDVVLACGFEKLFHEDKARTFAAFDGAVDTERSDGMLGALEALAEKAGEVVDVENAGKTRSVFMDIYSLMAIAHMKNHGPLPT
jgi:acetyl-CoA acetyltransferase